MHQQTLSRTYTFEGKGLHTGAFSHLCMKPASEDSGIRFVRTDLGVEIPALAGYISGTERSTSLSKDGADVCTVEHLLSALTGMGVDNATLELDNAELPILDGSAFPYAEAIERDGLCPQDAPRRYFTPSEPLEVRNPSSGSFVRVEPSDRFSLDVTMDFGSQVPGVQRLCWEEGDDYLGRIAPCRTFVFLHEVRDLASRGLVKGGDVDNAIVVVDRPVEPGELEKIARKVGRPGLKVLPDGYLSNLELRFPDECGRHKLLDLMGDLRLCGAWLHARVTAYKPGHGINAAAAGAIWKTIK